MNNEYEKFNKKDILCGGKSPNHVDRFIGIEIGCGWIYDVPRIRKIKNVNGRWRDSISFGVKEMALLYGSIYLTLMLTGPGKISLDHLIYHRL